MTVLKKLIKRNTKLFFKDKGMFFTSLVTPLILLVLYSTFLGNVYRDSFNMTLQGMGVNISDKLLNAIVGGQLFSSLLAVSCVTVSFCSNMLMVTDKVSGAKNDLLISPLKKSTLALSYYISTSITTLIVCFVAMGASLIYIAVTGWYISLTDIVFIALDIFLLVMFGTALSSIINHFLSTQGQISAVGTIISSGYGFICGAYMPISQFSDGLQKAVVFLPGTYGTSLLRNHAMRGAFAEMERLKYPTEAIEGLKNSVDCNLYFFNSKIEVPIMYAVLGISAALFVLIYVLINKYSRKKKQL